MKVYEALVDLDRQNQESIDFWKKILDGAPCEATKVFIGALEAKGRALTAAMLAIPISLMESEA